MFSTGFWQIPGDGRLGESGSKGQPNYGTFLGDDCHRCSLLKSFKRLFFGMFTIFWR